MMQEYSGTLPRTSKYDLDTPLSCLATNRDNNQVVVAGRNLIQVFAVEDLLRPTASCKIKNNNGNRPVKSGIQSKSNISDIAWSANDQKKLATASTNGSITIWQLNRQLIEEVTLAAHSRSAHKVLFCDDDPNLVLSASQDSTVKFFDLRSYGSSTDPIVSRQLMPKAHASPVRDVQYCPYSCYYLAVANENGDLHIWDLRNTKKYQFCITCHFCSIMSIDWYPITGIEGQGWLATAGCRDHLIKVWEINSKMQAAEPVCSIRTSNVNKICWRKEDYQLASSSNLNIDLNIHVWDIRRPFIPFASFEGHSDLVTGIKWSNDKNVFFSVGKDGALIKHGFANAEYIVNSISPIAADINPYGKLVAAVRSSNSLGSNNAVNKRINSMQPVTNPLKTPVPLCSRHKFSLTSSNLFQFSVMAHQRELEEVIGMNSFINLAKNYKLAGDSISKLCQTNYEAAMRENASFDASLWQIFSYLYATDHSSSSDSEINSPASGNKVNKEFGTFSSIQRQDTDKGLTSDGGNRQGVTDSDTNKDKSNSDENSDSQQEDIFSHSVDAFTMNFESPDNFLFANVTQAQYGQTMLCDSDYDGAPRFSIDSDSLMQILDSDQSFLSSKFRHPSIPNYTPASSKMSDVDMSTTVISTGPTRMINVESSHTKSSSKSSSRRNSRILKDTSNTGPINVDSCINESDRLVAPLINELTPKYEIPIYNFFQDLVDQNRVQIVCSAVIILFPKLNFRNLTAREEALMENWFQAYINLLIRYKLWTVVTQVIKFCPLSQINVINQQSTTFTTKCGKCHKILDKYGSICMRHSSDKQSIVCAICHLGVRGELLWCDGCSHGGHSFHISRWFETRQLCPTGCGHRCQF